MTKPEHNAFATPLPKGICYNDEDNHDGLSKREYFAAMALQGFLSSCTNAVRDPDVNHVAQKSVEYADALIKALNKTPSHESK